MRKSTTGLGRIASLLLASTAFCVPLAYAADATTPPPPPVAGDSQIGEIIVTAARHEQSLQKVSTAVVVFDGGAIRDAALSNVGQVFAETPSIQATAQPGGFSVDVRGLGGDLPAGSTQGSAAVVIDGVYNINSQGTTVGLFDTNRIEVSPGPQSTRFGPNADGGVVSIYSNDPQLDQLRASAAATVGNYKLFRGEAMVNVPLSPDLALRISGAALTRGSYFTPAQDEQRAQSFRVKLLYKPSDDLSLKLTYQFDHIGGAGNGSNVFPIYTNKVSVYADGSINQQHNPWALPSTVDGQEVLPNVNHANIVQQSLIGNLSYTLGKAVALDMLGSYSKLTGGEIGTIFAPPWSVTGGGPFPFTNVQLNEFFPFHQVTGEVRLHSTAQSKVTWNLGYYHWNYLEGYSLAVPPPQPNFFDQNTPVVTTTATNAIFGEVTYPITDQFRLIGGLRNSWDHRTFEFPNNGGIVGPFAINFSHFDYRAGAEYDVAPHSMVYATASSGYRPGGYSGINGATGLPSSFKSEVNNAFEFGSKNRFFGNMLEFNADVFYYKIRNYQDLDKYVGFTPNDGTNTVCSNGDTRADCVTPTFGVQAHTLGAEIQSRAHLSADDLIHVSATWLNAKFDKKQGPCATVGLSTAAQTMVCPDGYTDQSPNGVSTPLFYDIAGAVQPHSPKFSGSFGYDHTFHFADGARLTVGGNAFYSSDYWVNPVEDQTHYGHQPGYWLGNLNAKLVTADDRYSLSAYVRNIGNYAVKQSVLPATALGDPRTFGVTLAAKW